ncbi:unnamed protein product [Rhizophagus irregularis]|nr:unnamed protein product [Rhizophagus irregularis]
MSCSKILSGDLPELVYEIIKNFQNDYSTLHSCVLVNRLWCRLAIPLLWENPFSITTGNYNFIEVYLYNLDDYLKTKINDYQIINYLLPSNTLFNYPSFIRYLNICNVTFSIEKWLEANDKTSNSAIDLVHNIILTSVSEFKKLINMSIVKLFIENEVNLHTFKIEINNKHFDYFIYNDILEIILQNPNFIHNIRNLNLSVVKNHCKMHYQDDLILRNLGQILPSKLESLSLVLYMIKTNDFEVFLKNSQDTFFKKLSINNLVQGYSDDIDILPYIKKYIMKKKRVKYLAIKNTSSTFSISKGKDVDLSNLKDEVNEFKLYNIKVLKYVNICTDIYRFVNEID